MINKQIRDEYRTDDEMWLRSHEAPIMRDDSFFDTVDNFVIALRWPIFCFGMVALLFFIVAMILWLPWAK